MNAERRKQIQDMVKSLKEVQKDVECLDLEDIRDSEREAFDNMPEGLQQGEKGEQAQNALDTLDNAVGHLEDISSSLDSAISELEGIE